MKSHYCMWINPEYTFYLLTYLLTIFRKLSSEINNSSQKENESLCKDFIQNKFVLLFFKKQTFLISEKS